MSTMKSKKTTSAQDPRVETEPGYLGLRQLVTEKAYELFLKRGCEHGHDVEDWLEAERIVSVELRSGSRSKAAASQGETVPFMAARQRSLQR